MIVVRLMGGLGNQMFQYALGRRLALMHDAALKLDVSFLLDRTPRPGLVFRDYDLSLFPVAADIASSQDLRRVDWRESRMQKLCGPFLARLGRRNVKVVHERTRGFDNAILQSPDDSYFVGYWQCERYLAGASDVIRKDFALEPLLNRASHDLAERITASHSVCINVRRGDFVYNGFHGVCDINYFSAAAEWLCERHADAQFFVFSDDVGWCKSEFAGGFGHPYTIVGNEHAGSKFGCYLALMSMCTHFVIPNSTFAWWAAWLSTAREKVVITPRRWFADDKANAETEIVPSGWMRL